MKICFSDRDIKGASTLVDGNGDREGKHASGKLCEASHNFILDCLSYLILLINNLLYLHINQHMYEILEREPLPDGRICII